MRPSKASTNSSNRTASAPSRWLTNRANSSVSCDAAASAKNNRTALPHVNFSAIIQSRSVRELLAGRDCLRGPPGKCFVLKQADFDPFVDYQKLHDYYEHDVIFPVHQGISRQIG